MEIRQIEDKALAHFSYAIESNGKIAIIDPSRDPQPYYDYAHFKNGRIVVVIETHPHADFVSGHLEISRATRATIYASKLLGATYPHQSFDEGDEIALGSVRLRALSTPGHSPDSISILLEEEGKKIAVFTGDALFIGDCGRPDLRESVGNIQQKREDQARQLYHSLRKLAALPDDVEVFPAHGKGSLCGKGMSSAKESTIANEKATNWSLQKMTEDQFTEALLEGQPFVPKYFGYDVELNRKGAEGYGVSVSTVPILDKDPEPGKDAVIVDVRKGDAFASGHHQGAINIQDARQFETWLGSLVPPGEKFYLVAADRDQLYRMIARSAKIGYEKFIMGAFVFEHGNASHDHIDIEAFHANPEEYTIVDIRNMDEAHERIFPNSIHIPLHELPDRANEVPRNKTIVVHCAGGYRSAAGASILRRHLNDGAVVYDLGDHIKTFQS